jgi:hypothetical protein
MVPAHSARPQISLGNTMGLRLGMAGAALTATMAATWPAGAQETGLAGLHSWVKVGRKTCMLDHFHDGIGTGKTKRDAERAAIRGWEAFTIWEYGRPWGRYAISESKRATCTKTSDGAFNCQVTSRPCVLPTVARRKRQ